MEIAVEEFRVGDRVVLLNGHAVQVEAVSYYDDEIVVRWHAGVTYRKPHRLAGEREQLGSFLPRLRGETISVERRLEVLTA